MVALSRVKCPARLQMPCAYDAFRVFPCHNQTIEFDWGDDKAEANHTKHGVSFQEGATVFDDPLSVTFPGPDHSVEEERLIIIGHSHRGHLLFVAHTDLNDPIRIISAREATRHEKRVYEELS